MRFYSLGLTQRALGFPRQPSPRCLTCLTSLRGCGEPERSGAWQEAGMLGVGECNAFRIGGFCFKAQSYPTFRSIKDATEEMLLAC